MHAKASFISWVALFSIVSASAFGANVKGMINGRMGEALTVATDNGNVMVLLTESTTTKDDTGLFGLRTDELASVVLIPGLKVDIDGENNGQGQFVAKTITVDGDDLESSEMIQAGITPTAKQVEANIESIDANRRAIDVNRQSTNANAAQIDALKAEIEALKAGLAEHKQNSLSHEEKIAAALNASRGPTTRFIALTDYDVKTQGTIKFAFGSSRLSDESKAVLKNLAESATGMNGYIIEVVGHADSTGHDSVNTKLSADRAREVIVYLMQQGGVPVRRMVAPGAMGEYEPVASNETAAGRAENRRVDVKVLVHKAAGG